MPAHLEEVIQAAEEGVRFHQLTLPTKILFSGGKVESVECVMTDLGEPDESGRKRSIPNPHSHYKMPEDVLISAIGQTPDSAISIGQTMTPYGSEVTRSRRASRRFSHGVTRSPALP
jgi:NADPH-dependent glutamate synthase beta subunit-like oxidoreductase